MNEKVVKEDVGGSGQWRYHKWKWKWRETGYHTTRADLLFG